MYKVKSKFLYVLNLLIWLWNACLDVSPTNNGFVLESKSCVSSNRNWSKHFWNSSWPPSPKWSLLNHYNPKWPWPSGLFSFSLLFPSYLRSEPALFQKLDLYLDQMVFLVLRRPAPSRTSGVGRHGIHYGRLPSRMVSPTYMPHYPLVLWFWTDLGILDLISFYQKFTLYL